MNQQLEARKAELEIERGGQRIEKSENANTDRAEDEKLAEATTTAHGQEEKPVVASDAHSSAPQLGAEKAQKGVYQGVLLEHGAASYKFKPDMNKPEDRRDDSYFVTLQTADGKTQTLWGVDLENAVSAGHGKGQRLTVTVSENNSRAVMLLGSTPTMIMMARTWHKKEKCQL
ncbi:hypothetical protein SGGMMB4_05878 (plasmid) [Sodalis glossinidius str. 'morsitans']|nr:hypothetical protein [Sodalis glossinidius]CRL46908.1 hypothetical protein SGGMMB4_05878 [Sodalis glossinidius str. 'morsitans']